MAGAAGTSAQPGDLQQSPVDLRDADLSAALTDPARVGELLRAIDAYRGAPTTAYALKLASRTFVRPGELRYAEWSEIDLDKTEWRIPAARMKMAELHVVPLARQVVAWLRDLHAITGRGTFLFPSLQTKLRPISENTVNVALRRLGYTRDEMTGHGFRAMASPAEGSTRRLQARNSRGEVGRTPA